MSRIVDDLRYLHRSVIDALDSMRRRALALLGGDIAIVTFLFGTGTYKLTTNTPPLYGILLLIVGIILLLTSSFLTLWILQPISITTPPDTKDTRNLGERFDDNEAKYLRYMKSEYEDAADALIISVGRRSKMLVWATKLLAIGVIIMVVLKYI